MRAMVRATDLEGKIFEVEGAALYGRALQHEHDHLTGRLLIDMVGPVKREIIKRKMKKEAATEAAR
jgi:peptide deformylase